MIKFLSFCLSVTIIQVTLMRISYGEGVLFITEEEREKELFTETPATHKRTYIAYTVTNTYYYYRYYSYSSSYNA